MISQNQIKFLRSLEQKKIRTVEKKIVLDGQRIIDDHYVLYNNTGIPSINIIDFQYPNSKENFWHTTQDTPDKCSASSLESVGTVITTLIYTEESK